MRLAQIGALLLGVGLAVSGFFVPEMPSAGSARADSGSGIALPNLSQIRAVPPTQANDAGRGARRPKSVGRRAGNRRMKSRRQGGRRGAPKQAKSAVLESLKNHGTNFASIDDGDALKSTRSQSSNLEARGSTGSASSVGIGSLGTGSGGADTSLTRRETRIKGGKKKRSTTIAQPLLKQVLGSAERRIHLCYERALEERPALGGGRVMAELTVLPSGTIQRARVAESTLADRQVESCIVRVARTLQFPAGSTQAPTKVTYFWRFNPPRS